MGQTSALAITGFELICSEPLSKSSQAADHAAVAVARVASVRLKLFEERLLQTDRQFDALIKLFQGE